MVIASSEVGAQWTLDVQFQTNLPPPPHPPSPNYNQSIKRKQSKDDYCVLLGLSFRSAFVFSIWSQGFFSARVKVKLKPHYLLFYGYKFLLLQWSKNIRKLFYNYSQFQYSFCNQPVLFAYLENVNKLLNNDRIMHVNGQNQNKNKITPHSNKPHVLQFDLAHKQCSSIIKRWLH